MIKFDDTALLKIMNKKGLSQSKLVEMTDLCQSSMSEYVSGKTTPTIKTLVKWINALNVSPNEFFIEMSD